MSCGLLVSVSITKRTLSYSVWVIKSNVLMGNKKLPKSLKGKHRDRINIVRHKITSTYFQWNAILSPERLFPTNIHLVLIRLLHKIFSLKLSLLKVSLMSKGIVQHACWGKLFRFQELLLQLLSHDLSGGIFRYDLNELDAALQSLIFRYFLSHIVL